MYCHSTNTDIEIQIDTVLNEDSITIIAEHNEIMRAATTAVVKLNNEENIDFKNIIETSTMS